MVFIQYVLIIAGIFLFLSLGVMFLLKSAETKKRLLKQNKEMNDMLVETNEQFDELLDLLEEVNTPLEQVVAFVDELNNQIF